MCIVSFTMSLLKHCADGNVTKVKDILVHPKGRRIKVDVRDNHNWTCLHHAVKSGSVECVEFLLAIKELNSAAETFEGETALHIACTVPHISFDIVSMLIEANADLVNFVNNEEVDLLKCAIIRKRLDIVKLLIDNGAPVNKQDLDGDTALHIAAIELQLDVIRYLLYEAHCDATICNDSEKTACILLFAQLLDNLDRYASLSQEEIDCFEELATFTYNLYDVNNPNENELELNQMIHFGYRYGHPRSCLYARILTFFYVPPSKQYFLEKIVQSNVTSYHCLIIALLEDTNHTSTDNDRSFDFWSKFLLELFILFLADEPFFNEYISEIMSSGRRYSERSQAPSLCEFITKNEDLPQRLFEPQQLFSFLKALILYEIDFDVLMRCCVMMLIPTVMLTVFAPLAKFVVPDEVIDDLNRSIDIRIRNEVMELTKLCRKSIRTYYFKRYSHYTAIKALYSLNIPGKIRNFLCYNVCDFKF